MDSMMIRVYWERRRLLYSVLRPVVQASDWLIADQFDQLINNVVAEE